MREDEFIVLDPSSFPVQGTRGTPIGVVRAIGRGGYERHLLDPVSGHLLIATPVGLVASRGEGDRECRRGIPRCLLVLSSYGEDASQRGERVRLWTDDIIVEDQ